LQHGWAEEIAEPARLASHSLLLGAASAGQRLVAVGERGHILLSDDRGRSWRQAQSVPTRTLLTAVCFADSQFGVAVGHDEVILTTHDAGQTWALAHFVPQAQQPLLDVVCPDAGHIIAVGAYGIYFTSQDGGTNWSEKKFESAGDPGRDFHLNKIAAATSTRLYIAAEAGHLYRSDDRGMTWRELPSPYEGSFFGVKPLAGNVVLAYGLRGNLFRSADAGATWRRVQTGTQAMLTGAATLPDGALPGATVVIGLSGVVLVSHDAGNSFSLMQQEDRKGLAAALAVGCDALLVVGEGGARLLNIAPGVACGAPTR